MYYEELPQQTQDNVKTWLESCYSTFANNVELNGDPFVDFLVVGSYAGGHAQEDSDLDIVILVNKINWADMSIVYNDLTTLAPFFNCENSNLNFKVDISIISYEGIFYPKWHRGDSTKRLAYALNSQTSFHTKQDIENYYGNQ